MYVFANWKMYLDYTESVALASALKNNVKNSKLQLAVFPSALAFAGVKAELEESAVSVGAQNVYWVDRGGYTGEVSAAMYRGLDARYALVGHSERRHVFGETNHDVRQKLEAILAAGLNPVICVGETLKEREAGKTKDVLEIQLRAALAGLVWPSGMRLIIAYEPVWAISRGVGLEAAVPPCGAAAAEACQSDIVDFAGGLLPGVIPAVLYGGSVRPGTVSDYLTQAHSSGVLVGAAATTLASWQNICAEAERLA